MGRLTVRLEGRENANDEVSDEVVMRVGREGESKEGRVSFHQLVRAVRETVAVHVQVPDDVL